MFSSLSTWELAPLASSMLTGWSLPAACCLLHSLDQYLPFP